MAQKILLVNPIKKRRTAKQKAVTKKLIAFNKKRSKPARKRAPLTTKRKVKPMAAKRRKSRTAAQRAATKKLIAFNRRGGRKAPAKRRRRRNPIVASSAPRRRAAYRATRTLAPARRRRRRNPVRRMTAAGMMNTIFMPAVTAAAGALALDAAWGYLPLPENVKQGPMKHLAKAAGAMALYWGAGMVVKQKTAEAMAVGALTVVAHQAAKEAIMQFMPEVGIRMAAYDDVNMMGYYNAGLPAGGYARQNGALPAHGMGLYVPNGGGANNMAEYDEMGVYVG